MLISVQKGVARLAPKGFEDDRARRPSGAV
jgi:hypothetical protein